MSDFIFQNHGTIFTVTPVTRQAKKFVKSHVEKASILDGVGGSKHQMYIVHAALLSSAAIKTWTPEAVDKFIIGDLGAARTLICFKNFVSIHHNM